MRDQRQDDEAPAWLVRALRLLGKSPIQAQWQARKIARAFSGGPPERAREPAERHRAGTCAACGSLVDVAERKCPKCGHAMPSAVARALGSIGLRVPSVISASSLLGVAILAVYLRMMLTYPKSGYLSWETHALMSFGANFGPAVLEEHQVHRLLTSVFLHIGLIHLGFNLVALSQIGSTVEELFGRGRTVFFFALTGVAGSLASALVMGGVSAGASGAISGLIGVAAGWGQRSGTTIGRETRNRMLLWMGYTTVYGFLVNADHAAHGGGFVAGGLIGLAYKPETLKATRHGAVALAMGVVGSLVALAGFALAMKPPASSFAYGEKFKPMTENFARPSSQFDDLGEDLGLEFDARDPSPAAPAPTPTGSAR